MPKTEDYTTLPPPPRGVADAIKRDWRLIVKAMTDQGIDPYKRFDLLDNYMLVIGQEYDLDCAWGSASLRDRLAISKQISALFPQKLRLRTLLLAPEIKEIKTPTKTLSEG
jgi:hypothetical protein